MTRELGAPTGPDTVPSGVRLWLLGARLRTLGAAVAPVLVGTAVALAEVDGVVGEVVWWRAICALVVAVALQVGVNYANDYSDGIRGTDDDRAGPLRLTASGLVLPGAVRNAAAISFGVAAVAGLALCIVVDLRLLIVGVCAVAAAILYTGGPKPYGYSGLGEVFVLVFFGFVATAGSTYVQHREITVAAWWGSLAMGLFACAVLLVNNIRDVPTDARMGKRTLAVRVGAERARIIFVLAVVGAYVSIGAISVTFPWAVLGVVTLPLAWSPVRIVMCRTDPASLVSALIRVARLELLTAVALSIGLAMS